MSSASGEGLRETCLLAGMDMTPMEATPDVESLEGQDPQAHAEGVLKRRIAALIDKVSSVVFSYVAQVLAPSSLPEEVLTSKMECLCICTYSGNLHDDASGACCAIF